MRRTAPLAFLVLVGMTGAALAEGRSQALPPQNIAPFRIAQAAGAAVPGAPAQADMASQVPPDVSRKDVPNLSGYKVNVAPFATGLSHPWGMAFLPDGRLLVTEREGRIRIVGKDGKAGPAIAGVPKVFAVSQGGLLGVALDPDFAQNRRIYFSYAEPRAGGAATAVARAVLPAGEARLEKVEVIFRQEPAYSGGNHFGSRLVFARDGNLFVTLGERFDLRDKAQDLSTTLGKIVRIRPDGSVPPDNPFVGRAGARPEIFSYGHRNVQGAALDPATGELVTVEHGARGGDEVNRPRAGHNYGWPVISYGRHYSGAKIGEGTAKAGMDQPIFYWDPSIAPSGALFYTGDLFPRWKDSLFVGGLAAEALVRLTFQDGRVTSEERLPLEKRMRDVVQGPDGALYLAIDAEEGEILRLTPAR